MLVLRISRRSLRSLLEMRVFGTNQPKNPRSPCPQVPPGGVRASRLRAFRADAAARAELCAERGDVPWLATLDAARYMGRAFGAAIAQVRAGDWIRRLFRRIAQKSEISAKTAKKKRKNRKKITKNRKKIAKNRQKSRKKSGIFAKSSIGEARFCLAPCLYPGAFGHGGIF